MARVRAFIRRRSTGDTHTHTRTYTPAAAAHGRNPTSRHQVWDDKAWRGVRSSYARGRARRKPPLRRSYPPHRRRRSRHRHLPRTRRQRRRARRWQPRRLRCPLYTTGHADCPPPTRPRLHSRLYHRRILLFAAVD